jgi:PAS domain S-box-containing protein
MVPNLPILQQRSMLAIRGGDHEYQQEFQAIVDGEVLWLTEKVEITRLGAAEWQLVGVVVDVTTRRQAEENLRVSEARYRQLMEHSPLAIIELDVSGIAAYLAELQQGGVSDLRAYVADHAEDFRSKQALTKIVGVNNAAAALVRIPFAMDLLKSGRLFLPESLMETRMRVLDAMWEGRFESEGETAFLAYDGATIRSIYHWWVPMLDGRPNLKRSQLILVDLSDVRRAEQALADEQERLSVTLRAMSEAVLTTDTNGIVQYINTAAEQMTGWTAATSVGHNLSEVCVLEHARSHVSVPLPEVTGLDNIRVSDLPTQTALKARNGDLTLVEGRLAALHGVNGSVLGTVLVLRDMTERARLEAEQLRSSKLESLGILAGGIAHDFNNLLTVVMGNLTLAMLDSQVMAAAGRWLKESERGVLRARDLTHQLLTFAKGGDPVRAAVSLADIVRDTTEFAMHGAKARKILEFAPELWPADVDKTQICQVVQNIVINAVQAMPEGGVLRVSLDNAVVSQGEMAMLAPGRYLKLTISDSGVGIKQEHLSRIFDPYFTTKPTGTGLGLATVYSIVKKHQGHIDVESVSGRGTTFHIWLPAAKHAPPSEQPGRSGSPLKTGRILFMDDEEPIRRLGQALLQSLGYEARVVADGKAAVREYELATQAKRPFDLVMLDLTVPGGMGGLETLGALRKINPEVKAIVTSGYSSDPVLGNYRSNGFLGVVPKPYRISDLGRTVQAVLNGETV